MEINYGWVKWFDKSRRFGFIGRPGGEDVFVHLRDVIQSGLRGLYPGWRVEFRIACQNVTVKANKKLVTKNERFAVDIKRIRPRSRQCQ